MTNLRVGESMLFLGRPYSIERIVCENKGIGGIPANKNAPIRDPYKTHYIVIRKGKSYWLNS